MGKGPGGGELAAFDFPSLQTGGLFSFTDLNAPDYMGLLPITSAAFTLISSELNSSGGHSANRTVMRTLAIATAGFTAWFPSVRGHPPWSLPIF
ncbi:hypothetical protein H696_04623 [Fonticula alba]|uniref:Uncharacterized protein n=1 Tax=Fonticula alba TaxID=691883 RepID=A0A058Z4J4_FONAL|nr:hypothetical protein H696_04623 [Fonticula alba]KCV69209.1 hypothetical protein H696_04623 [Fonticula alba]|eukprot:XP_009496780.1 hypothetical protein H696_04623 [Fonticula alba]